MKTVYIIQYDDNVAYEEGSAVLLVALSKQSAERVTAELNEWLVNTRKQLPKIDLDIWNDGWIDQSKKRDAAIKSMQVPYGLEPLRYDFEYNREGTIRWFAVRCL